MDIVTLLLLAIGLAMDAFAVSVSTGMTCRVRAAHVFKMAGSFGVFQGLMPLIGYMVANAFSAQIQAVDHWVAFVLLSFVGAKMLWENLRGKEAAVDCSETAYSWKRVGVLALATSIDALAVGVSLAVMPHTGMLAPAWGYLVCCAVVALVTFVLCTVGLFLGGRFGRLLGNKAEIAGGLVLIAIGLKILLEHTLA